MKTPRRKSKTQDIDQQTSSIPVGEAKALFDAVSQDNTKHITLGVPRALGETEVSDQEDPQNEAVLPDESPELDLNLENVIDQAFEKAGLPSDVTTDQLVNQAVEQMNAEEIDFDALIEQGTAMMEQLIAGFDNPDRIGHVVAMAQCDALIKQYDQQRFEQATKPPVKPLRLGWFSWL